MITGSPAHLGAAGPVELPEAVACFAAPLAARLDERFPGGRPFTGVAVALDGSASMRAAYGRGEVDRLLHLVLGLSAAIGAGPVMSVVVFDTEVHPVADVSVGRWDHVRSDVSGDRPLASGSLHAPAMRMAVRSLTQRDGVVVTIADGPPPDLAQVVGLVSDTPDACWVHLVIGHAAPRTATPHWSGAGGTVGTTDDLTRLRKSASGLVVVSEANWMPLRPEQMATRIIDAIADHLGAVDRVDRVSPADHVAPDAPPPPEPKRPRARRAAG